MPHTTSMRCCNLRAFAERAACLSTPTFLVPKVHRKTLTCLRSRTLLSSRQRVSIYSVCNHALSDQRTHACAPALAESGNCTLPSMQPHIARIVIPQKCAASHWHSIDFLSRLSTKDNMPTREPQSLATHLLTSSHPHPPQQQARPSKT